jgi:hypothetical protein
MRLFSARRSRVVTASLIAGFTALAAASELYRRHNFTGYFEARRGTLAGADITFRESGDGWERFDVVLRNDRGVEIDAILQVPAAGGDPAGASERSTPPTDTAREVDPALDAHDAAPRPSTTLLVLAGVRTNRRSIESIERADSLVMLFIDYPYEGKRSKLGAVEFLAAIPRIRRAILDTPAAVNLATEFLMTRPEVDRTRILLVGGSFGALVGPVAAACEPRIAGAAFLFGAGDLAALMAANIDAPRILAWPAARALALLTSPVEPTKYIGQIAPRPVFLLNGRFDERIPESCSRALHDAAGEPKRIRWIAAEHLQIHSDRLRSLVRSEFEAWLLDNGFQ